MREKILALDIDGTLTNSEKDISPATKAALFRMMEKGHKVILASGRPSAVMNRNWSWQHMTGMCWLSTAHV